MSVKMGCIYKITNTVNNKIYIGLTTRNVQCRFKEHIDAANKGHHLHLYKSIRKYGQDKFELSIIEDNLNNDEIGDREIYWINKLNPEYNTLLGGNMGRNEVVLAKIKGEDERYRLIKKDEFNTNRDLYEHFTDNKIVAFCICEEKYILIDKEEYYNNKERYIVVLKGKTIVYDKIEHKNILIDVQNYKSNTDRYSSIYLNSVVAKMPHEENYKRVPLDDFYSNDEYITPSNGTLTVFDHESGTTKRITLDEFYNSNNKYDSVVKGTVTVFDKEKNKYYRIKCEEYANNKDKFCIYNSLNITVIDRNSGIKINIPLEEYRINKDKYKCLYEGMVNVKDKKGNSKRITKEEYHSNKDEYSNSTQGKKTVFDLSKLKIVKIFEHEINKNPNNFITKQTAIDLNLIERKKLVLDIKTDKIIYITESEYNNYPEKYGKVTADKRYKNGKRTIKKRT